MVDMNPTQVDGNKSSTSWSTIDVSGAVAEESTMIDMNIVNASDFPVTFHWRKTDTTDSFEKQLQPLESFSLNIGITTALTVDYKVTEGTVTAWITNYSGTGLIASGATVYTTAAKVASLLRMIAPATQARFEFTGTSDPTLSEVERYITRAEDEIDEQTHHAWRAVTVSDEYHDIGMPWNGLYRRELPVKLNHRSIRSLTSGTDKIEVWDGSEWKDLVLTANGYTEGRSDDFWIDATNGVSWFVGTKPRYEKSGVRVTYRYGESTVSKDIEDACTMIAAINILMSDDYTAQLPEGTSQYSVSQKIETWQKKVDKILSHHEEIRAVFV